MISSGNPLLLSDLTKALILRRPNGSDGHAENFRCMRRAQFQTDHKVGNLNAVHRINSGRDDDRISNAGMLMSKIAIKPPPSRDNAFSNS